MKFHSIIFNRTIASCFLLTFIACITETNAQVGVGTKPPAGAVLYFDGTKEMLDANWTYWKGPRLAATLPIKWAIEKDPVDNGTVVNSNDPAAAGGKYGSADIVTKERVSGLSCARRISHR